MTHEVPPGGASSSAAPTPAQSMDAGRSDVNASFSPSSTACAPLTSCPFAGGGAAPVRHDFAWIAPHRTDRRHYVNLPNAWDTVNNGRVAKLVGEVSPPDAGVLVQFRLVPNAANNTHTDAASVQLTSYSTLNGRVEVDLNLPVFGGAKYKVEGATTDMATPDISGEIQVWRKFFYQVTTMANPPAPSTRSLALAGTVIPAVQAMFAPTFIEVAPSERSAATTPYVAHLTAAQRDTLETSLRTSARDARTPFKLNIITIDRSDIPNPPTTWTGSAAAPLVVTPSFPHWPHEPTVISAEYKTAATPAPDGTWAAMTGVAVLTPGDGTAMVQAVVPGWTAACDVRITYRSLRGAAGGWAGRNGAVFICSGVGSSTADIQQTIAHEVGHNLGLVPGAPTAPSTAWHDPAARDNPYQPKHCGYNRTGTPPGACIMWFMLGQGNSQRFCTANHPSDCSFHLKRSDYSGLNWI